MAGKRFAETKIEVLAVDADASPQYRCAECSHEFEYDNVNSPNAEEPNFCPNCGRRNA